jgi:hypothetical protein
LWVNKGDNATVMGEQPELVRVLQEVFDEIWLKVEPKVDERDADERRSELAREIIMAHKKGLKPEEIKTAMLEKLPAGR